MEQAEKIADIVSRGSRAFDGATDEASLREAEIRFLGRKSELTEVLRGLKDCTPEEKRELGPAAQEAKRALTTARDVAKARIERDGYDFEAERIDVTAPGVSEPVGHLHPVTQIEHEVEDIFYRLGFTVVDGPEIEREHYNFDALNFPKDHPARDMQDTFWMKSEGMSDRYLLRTHTTAAQVRYMETHEPPLRIIVPGRVYRNEATDASHEHTFHQFDSLMEDERGVVTVGHFKHVAEMFFEAFFGRHVEVRLRPSFFPFVEPGFEFDVSCGFCGGSGCPICKQSGWIEVGGAGMVQQKVFEAAGYERGKYQGFAWGFGLTRLAMMKYGVNDIRLFMSGDLRFVRQF